MSNTLLKRSRATYNPGSPGVAASAGAPASGAYTSYSLQTVCGYRFQGGTYRWVLVGNEYQYLFLPNEGETVGTATYVCTEQQVPTYHPATSGSAPTAGVAPTAEQTAYDYNFGWNAGARSSAFLTGDGYIQFTALAGVSGAVVGLNDADADAGYLNIEHAFYLTHGVARVLESGVEKAYLGAYASGATFRIDRKFGVVSYYIDNVLQYTSTAPSTGVVFMDASLYAGGDAVDNPVIAAYNAGAASASFEPMQAFASDGTAYAIGSASFLPMTSSGTSIPRGSASASFEPLQVLSADRPYGVASNNFEPMTAASEPGQLVPSYAVATAIMAPMTTSGIMLTGQVATASASFAPLLATSADRPYGASSISFEPMTSDASAYEGNLNASMRELMVASTRVVFDATVDVVMMSAAGAGMTLATLTLKNAAMAESVNVAGTMTYSAVMQAVMRSLVSAFAGVPVLTQDGEQWVINDESGASTSYEGYGFNSFAKYQGKYLGAKAGGVYLLEGDTDAGAAIRASISLGKQDFGTSVSKAVPNCYIGMSSTGRVFLKVIADGEEYIYSTVANTAYTDIQRVKLGRGLSANHLTFELFNKDGADFEFNSVEFDVAVLTRRT